MNKRRPDTDLIVDLTLILTEKYIGCSHSKKLHGSPYNFTSLMTLYIYILQTIQTFSTQKLNISDG